MSSTSTLKKTLPKFGIERAKLVFGMPYRREIASLRLMDHGQFWEYQGRQFAKIYCDAIRHVPFYRDQTDDYPLQLSKANSILDVLALLPTLPKSIVKTNTEQFWREPAFLGSAVHTTGGTTGTPMRIRASLRERGFTNAILEDRYLDIAGKRNPRILRMSGFLDQTAESGDLMWKVPGTPIAYLSIYQLSQSNRSRIEDALRSFRPEVIHGYASAIHQLALLFDASTIDPRLSPQSVVSTSETLSPEQRIDIERLLDTTVFNEYGSQEGQHLVLECKFQTLHIHPARGIVEILAFDSDRPAKNGEIGRVVVSGIALRSMPLIRYELGDTAVSTEYDAQCKCGLRWPSIGTVYGRMEDLVRMRDGRRIPLLSHSTLKDVSGIQESQLIQTGYEQFTYRIVPQANNSFVASEMESHVRMELSTRLGLMPEIAFEYVDHIERTASGKLRAVVVNMSES